jgi:hypothetical protein
MMTTFLFLKHEKLLKQNTRDLTTNIKTIRNIITEEEDFLLSEAKGLQQIIVHEAEQEAERISAIFNSGSGLADQAKVTHTATLLHTDPIVYHHNDNSQSSSSSSVPSEPDEKLGLLKCNGQYIDSEVIYWKIVPGDDTYESPITPHHGQHHDRYLSYEYDEGGWNNIRMG